MTLYQRYQKLDIDLSQLGLERGESRSDYLCTPKGAKVIGWEGGDGIHYCFLKGFGDMVFAVNPSNLPGDQVHPLARSFEDFLRLVLACGHTAAPEQAHLWGREGFQMYLEEDAPSLTPERQATLDGLRDGLSLTPMDDPYGYIRDIQANFDYASIPFRKGYGRLLPEEPKQPVRPEWGVYFDGNFSSHQGRDRPGKEVPIHATFQWDGHLWHVPAVYLCGKGLVADFCIQVEPGEIRAWQDKWKQWTDYCRGEDDALTPEQRDQMMAEHPLTFQFDPGMEANGRALKRQGGSGFSWMPVACLPPEAQDPDRQQLWEAIRLMEHYGLDPEKGWAFCRESFPWASKAKPALRTLKLRLSQSPQPIPGPRFTVHEPGETVPFTHPVTGDAHTLHVTEYERQELGPERLTLMDSEQWDYPPCYTSLGYAITPDLPAGALSLRDCGDGDRPRLKTPLEPGRPTVASSVGILLAHRRGETTLLPDGAEALCRAASSALRFQHPEEIQWRMTFYRKTAQDVEIELPLPRN